MMESSSAPLIVTATLDPTTLVISNASKTLNEVVTAAKSGKTVMFQLSAEVDGTVFVYATFPTADIKDTGVSQTADFFSPSIDIATNKPEYIRVSAASGNSGGAWMFDTIPFSE